MTVAKPVRLKRKLRGADGGIHPHVKNAQQYPPIEKTPQLRRSRLRDAVLDFLGMVRVWGADRQCERTARIAVEALIIVLDKERK